MITHILCPIDFSEHSERALTHALELGRKTGARLTLVTVVNPFLDAGARAAGSGEALAAQTQAELQALFLRAVPAGSSAQPPSIAVVVGEPAEEILKCATECGADVIVMGMQGLGGAEKWIMGSTTEQVLRRSHVPVLAIPPPRPTPMPS